MAEHLAVRGAEASTLPAHAASSASNNMASSCISAPTQQTTAQQHSNDKKREKASTPLRSCAEFYDVQVVHTSFFEIIV